VGAPPRTDLDRVRPWAGLIDEVCALTGENRWRFGALGLRESGWGWAPGYFPKGDPCGTGDHGHGFGLFQIDDRYHASFVRSADAQEPFRQALYACRLLREARDWFKRSAARAYDADHLEHAVYAAYNAGPGRVYHQIVMGLDPDEATTGKDYSRWIWAKAAALELDAPDLFGPPLGVA
jgi:hypothetical protein